ncbi:hypothetical protein APHAL10511_004218 [Amanita phalloides]|nr:hypothetical protein APHAL10511_004218 [Amanita phalloides]
MEGLCARGAAGIESQTSPPSFPATTTPFISQPPSSGFINHPPPSRLGTVPELSTLFSGPPLHVAIPAVSTNNSINLFGQDVSGFVNTTASLASPSSANRHSVYPSSQLGTSIPSGFNFNQHGLIKSNIRPRTSNQVFKTGEELALHYGIPTWLPPPPQTTPKNQPTSPILDFENLRANYLNMISEKATDDMVVDKHVPTPADLLPTSHMENPDVALEEWITVFSSPQFQGLHEFLTSPAALQTPAQDFESSPNETPYSDFLNTPLLGLSDDDNLFCSPTVNSDLPLFATDERFTASPDKTKSAELPELPEMLYQMPPLPENDFVNPAAVYPSPSMSRPSTSFSTIASTHVPSTSVAAALDISNRRSSATGTRKNISPEKLIPLDAPTQPRRYLSDSATSRKDIPAGFQKKRKRVDTGGEEDELLERLPPNATEVEQIEYKRRQNTLAARKSRHRKLMYQQELEDKVERLSEDVTRWQTRCDVLSKLLESHGIPPPTFDV